MGKKLKFILYFIIQYLTNKLGKYNKKLPYILISGIALAIVIYGIKFFIKLTKSLQTDYLKAFDTQVTDYVASYRSPALTNFFITITDVGDVWGYLVVFSLATFLLYYFFRKWRYVVKLVFVLIIAISSNLLLKQLINRARPTAAHLVTVKTLSYPSGHAMTAMAFYGFLIYLLFTFRMNKVIKYSLITCFAFLIFSIGVSRIYLGVHYPSDVIGGFIAGFIWVIFCILLLNLFKIFRNYSKIERFVK